MTATLVESQFEFDNPNPIIKASADENDPPALADSYLDGLRDELFSIIRHIRDPEHSLTLEQLGVVTKSRITFKNNIENNEKMSGIENSDENNRVIIEIIPTVPHCSLATLIGLCIRTRVLIDWPQLKLTILIGDNSHLQARDISKQLNDKERCCAAIENPALKSTIDSLINFQSSID